MTSIGWHSYLLRMEAERPDSPALVGPGETLNFRQLGWRGRKFAAALQRAGVVRGQIVMVRARRDYDFQFTLALSMIGAVAISNTGKQYLDFIDEVDWLVTRTLVTGYPAAKQIVVDDIWVQRAFNNLEPFEILGLESEDSIERICLTSGTTGKPKAVAFSHRIHHLRVVAQEEATNDSGVELYLADMGAAIGALRAFAATLYGLPYLHLGDKSPSAMVEVFVSAKVTRLAGSPIQVSEILHLFERQRVDLSGLTSVRVGGAGVSQTLIHRVTNLTNATLQMGYGSTEAGPSAFKRPVTEPSRSIGRPMPGVHFEIIDDAGKALPPGEVGRLRVRAEYAAAGYWADSTDSNEAFIDGWFYPGDVARFLDNGELELLGRADDLLNLGGVKVAPNDVEELASNMLGIPEPIAIQIEDPGGNSMLCIVTTATPPRSTKAFEKSIASRYKLAPRIAFLAVTELPRNEAGKVLRAQLAELARSRFA